jgi:hypothetical protein
MPTPSNAILGPSNFLPFAAQEVTMRAFAWHPRFETSFTAMALLGLFVALSGCVTHRGDPPTCKGPYTPINQPAGVTHGS